MDIGVIVTGIPIAAHHSIFLLAVASGEDAGDVVQHVGGAGFVVAKVLDQALLDDVDFLLGFVVDDAADQVLELDRVALVFEELELQP